MNNKDLRLYFKKKVSTAQAYNSGHTATLRSTQISLRETSYVRKTLYEKEGYRKTVLLLGMIGTKLGLI